MEGNGAHVSLVKIPELGKKLLWETYRHYGTVIKWEQFWNSAFSWHSLCYRRQHLTPAF